MFQVKRMFYHLPLRYLAIRVQTQWHITNCFILFQMKIYRNLSTMTSQSGSHLLLPNKKGTVFTYFCAIIVILSQPSFTPIIETHYIAICSYKLLVVGGGAGGCSTAAKFASKLGKGQVAVLEPSEVSSYRT